MEYAIVKWLHVLSSTVLFGTGVGSAFYMLRASLNRDAAVAHFVAKQVVIADWIFTATTVVLQPVSGLYLAHLAHMPLTARWLLWSLILYFLAGACWLPVVWIQIRMRDLSGQAAEQGRELPDAYWDLFRIWFTLGIPAFLALVVVFYLMVVKPA